MRLAERPLRGVPAAQPDGRHGNDGRGRRKASGRDVGATQGGLEIVGTGDSAARATEDMARQIAERKEAGKL